MNTPFANNKQVSRISQLLDVNTEDAEHSNVLYYNGNIWKPNKNLDLSISRIVFPDEVEKNAETSFIFRRENEFHIVSGSSIPLCLECGTCSIKMFPPEIEDSLQAGGLFYAANTHQFEGNINASGLLQANSATIAGLMDVHGKLTADGKCTVAKIVQTFDDPQYGPLGSEAATFGHKDYINWFACSFRQLDDGGTVINSENGTSIAIKINYWGNVNSYGNGFNSLAEFTQSGAYFHCDVSFGGHVNGQPYNASDDRLKHNEVVLSDGLSVIRRLVPKTYEKSKYLYEADYNGEVEDSIGFETGFIAQDVQSIPQLEHTIGTMKGETRDGEKVEHYKLRYTDIFVYGIAAIKELDAKVDSLETENKALKTILSAYDERLRKLETPEAVN